MSYLQNGDVLLFEDNLPKGAKKTPGSILHKGLNHTHGIKGSFSLYKAGDKLFLKADKGCTLVHEEHKPIKLPPGVYRKEIVKEYDHWLNESREVID
jgi:hypothetical protein